MKNQQQFYEDMSRLIRDGNAGQAAPRLRDWLQQAPDDAVATSLLGSALLRSGNEDEALEVLREAADAQPASFAAFGDLGFACAYAGHAEDAIAAYRQAVELNDRFYPGWCALSRLLFARKSLSDAREAFKRADACDPLLAEFREVQEAMSAERFAAAERRCRDLLSMQPGYPRAAYTLAHLAARVGAFEQAAALLGQAIDYFPCDVNLRAALVVNLEEAGQYAAAVAQAREITQLDPEVVASWLILGRVHGHCGSYEDALSCFDRALNLAGSDQAIIGNVQLLRGHLLKILGRNNASISAYRASIAATPGNGAGWWGLADMKTYRFEDEDIAAMTGLAVDEKLRREQRAQAAFALGKANEDRKLYEEAFDWYTKANALRSDARFDSAKQAAGVRDITRAYDFPVLNIQADPVPQGPTPIFILGLPRAGSTLLEQILASHSQVEGTMELATLPNLVRRITIEGGQRNIEYPSSMASFSPEQLNVWGQAYLDDTAMYRTDKSYFIDKLPTNFDKIGLIHKILPQAIVIDARRHPLDCGLSCFKQHFAGGHLWSYSLEHIGAYFQLYLALMDYWDRVLPGKVLCVQYEQVVANTEQEVRRMLEHCGLPFEESCLRFHENQRPVRTASSEQVRQPIYSKAVAHWQCFEQQLEPLKKALGTDVLQRFNA